MEYPFETSGVIRFDPDRGNMKKRTEWWCVIELDDSELADYYRWFVDRNWCDADSSKIKRRYLKSPHMTHISLVRGEKPTQNVHLWGKHLADVRVTFRYNNQIRQTSNAYYANEPDKFWFIDTEWEPYVGFRKTFGLPWEYKNKPFRSHMTIARTFD